MNEQRMQAKLKEYYKEHYDQYDEEAEFYINPESNQWVFDIPSISQHVTLICDEDSGVVRSMHSRKGTN